jgi:phosphocarrier protein
MSRSQAEVEIMNELGLHLRAAAAFAKVAEGYGCEVLLEHGTMSANGKSVIALVTLAAARGSRVRIVAEGEGAEEAVDALVDLIAGRFGEQR